MPSPDDWASNDALDMAMQNKGLRGLPAGGNSTGGNWGGSSFSGVGGGGFAPFSGVGSGSASYANAIRRLKRGALAYPMGPTQSGGQAFSLKPASVPVGAGGQAGGASSPDPWGGPWGGPGGSPSGDPFGGPGMPGDWQPSVTPPRAAPPAAGPGFNAQSSSDDFLNAFRRFGSFDPNGSSGLMDAIARYARGEGDALRQHAINSARLYGGGDPSMMGYAALQGDLNSQNSVADIMNNARLGQLTNQQQFGQNLYMQMLNFLNSRALSDQGWRQSQDLYNKQGDFQNQQNPWWREWGTSGFGGIGQGVGAAAGAMMFL